MLCYVSCCCSTRWLAWNWLHRQRYFWHDWRAAVQANTNQDATNRWCLPCYMSPPSFYEYLPCGISYVKRAMQPCTTYNAIAMTIHSLQSNATPAKPPPKENFWFFFLFFFFHSGVLLESMAPVCWVRFCLSSLALPND